MDTAVVRYEQKISHGIGHKVAPYLGGIPVNYPTLCLLTSFESSQQLVTWA